MTKTSLVVATIVVATAYALTAQPAPRLRLRMEDYAQLPISGELDGQNTRGELARVNGLHDEPGDRRFFVNDLNGPLYILDKQARRVRPCTLISTASGGRSGLFPKFTFERNFAMRVGDDKLPGSTPTTRATASSIRCTWRTRVASGSPAPKPRCRPRPRFPHRLHNHAGRTRRQPSRAGLSARSW